MELAKGARKKSRTVAAIEDAVAAIAPGDGIVVDERPRNGATDDRGGEGDAGHPFMRHGRGLIVCR